MGTKNVILTKYKKKDVFVVKGRLIGLINEKEFFGIVNTLSTLVLRTICRKQGVPITILNSFDLKGDRVVLVVKSKEDRKVLYISEKLGMVVQQTDKNYGGEYHLLANESNSYYTIEEDKEKWQKLQKSKRK